MPKAESLGDLANAGEDSRLCPLAEAGGVGELVKDAIGAIQLLFRVFSRRGAEKPGVKRLDRFLDLLNPAEDHTRFFERGANGGAVCWSAATRVLHLCVEPAVVGVLHGSCSCDGALTVCQALKG